MEVYNNLRLLGDQNDKERKKIQGVKGVKVKVGL